MHAAIVRRRKARGHASSLRVVLHRGRIPLPFPQTSNSDVPKPLKDCLGG